MLCSLCGLLWKDSRTALIGVMVSVLTGVLVSAQGIIGFAPAVATPSDPIRNVAPEQAAPPDDVENPIYYNGPMGAVTGTVGDVSGVVPEALLNEFLRAHSALNYPAAVEWAMRLVQSAPSRPVGHYNLACALARLGREDEAIAALHAAVECGWRETLHTSIDPDLAILRHDDRFVALLAEMKSRVEAERIVPRPLRDDPWEMIAAEISREAPDILARHHVPGALVAVIHDGRAVWSSAFGNRNGRGEPASLGVDDRVRLRAPLHLMVIAACERLERDNKLRLSSLIVDAANEHAEMTVLNTRGGSIGGAMPASRRSTGDGQAVPARDRAIRSKPAGRMYGRHSVYGSMRIAVEHAFDQSFMGFCEEALFAPLGMRRSGFAVPDDGVPIVSGHSALGTPLRPNAMQDEFAPGGCLYTTAGDIATLIASSMHRRNDPLAADHAAVGDLPGPNEAIYDVRTGGPAGGQSIDDAARFAAAIDMVTQADSSLAGALALAIRRSERDGIVAYHMEEAAAGIVLLARWHPQTSSGVVVICNSVTASEAARRIAQIALGGE